MRAEGGNQLFEGASGMSDRVESGHRAFDAKDRLCDALQRLGNERVLVGEYGP